MQLRVNMERMGPDGSARPSGGTLTAFEPPKGDGICTDSYGYAGCRTSPRFDSLLAKLIVHETTDGLNGVIQRAERALGEFRIEGVATNVPFLQSLLRHPEFRAGNGYTRFIEDHIGDLVTHDGAAGPPGLPRPVSWVAALRVLAKEKVRNGTLPELRSAPAVLLGCVGSAASVRER